MDDVDRRVARALRRRGKCHDRAVALRELERSLRDGADEDAWSAAAGALADACAEHAEAGDEFDDAAEARDVREHVSYWAAALGHPERQAGPPSLPDDALAQAVVRVGDAVASHGREFTRRFADEVVVAHGEAGEDHALFHAVDVDRLGELARGFPRAERLHLQLVAARGLHRRRRRIATSAYALTVYCTQALAEIAEIGETLERDAEGVQEWD